MLGGCLGHRAGSLVPTAAAWMELTLRAEHTSVRTSRSQVGLREGLSNSMSYKFGRSRQNAQTALSQSSPASFPGGNFPWLVSSLLSTATCSPGQSIISRTDWHLLLFEVPLCLQRQSHCSKTYWCLSAETLSGGKQACLLLNSLDRASLLIAFASSSYLPPHLMVSPKQEKITIKIILLKRII